MTVLPLNDGETLRYQQMPHKPVGADPNINIALTTPQDAER